MVVLVHIGNVLKIVFDGARLWILRSYSKTEYLSVILVVCLISDRVGFLDVFLLCSDLGYTLISCSL